MTGRAIFPVPQDLRCLACNAALTAADVVDGDYRCPSCGADVGHLDLAANGAVRGIFGWLHRPGDLLAGRYRVRGFLGKGGFAATYLVLDERLAGKRRAVKEIPQLFFNESEAEILARVHHPAIPDIIDRFSDDGMVYLVLEFGGDRSLEGVRKAEGGRISYARAWPWIDQLCDVLAYLHTQTPPIVHRDLKPANVLLDEADRVMLIDFGIAKSFTPSMTTRTVARSASDGFSPPEQAMGIGTDQRSDVYALGATLYLLLTGIRPPAAHERVAGADVISPRQRVPDLPAGVEATILRALELSVARRHASIADFRAALAGSSDGAGGAATADVAPRTVLLGSTPAVSRAAASPLRAKTASALTRGRAVLLAAVAGAVVSAGAAAWWLTQREAERPAAASPAAQPAPLPAGKADARTPDAPAPDPDTSSALEELRKNRQPETPPAPEPQQPQAGGDVKSNATQPAHPQQPRRHKKTTRPPADNQWIFVR